MFVGVHMLTTEMYLQLHQQIIQRVSGVFIQEITWQSSLSGRIQVILVLLILFAFILHKISFVLPLEIILVIYGNPSYMQKRDSLSKNIWLFSIVEMTKKKDSKYSNINIHLIAVFQNLLLVLYHTKGMSQQVNGHVTVVTFYQVLKIWRSKCGIWVIGRNHHLLSRDMTIQSQVLLFTHPILIYFVLVFIIPVVNDSFFW